MEKKEIKLLELKLKNFKGIKVLKINFEGKNTNIYGANATGKTTIFDAFKWLFFDKDSNDKTDFSVKTLNKDNEVIHFLEHEVEAILLINNQDITFKRSLVEKWVKKRGNEEQTFDGNKNNYWIDDVPLKQKDYEDRVNGTIPENLFKMVTDPLFFNEFLSKEERQKELFSIAGMEYKDEDILNSDKKFSVLVESLKGKSVDEYSKILAEQIKLLKKKNEEIPARIDELTNTLITDFNINYEDLEKEKVLCNEELKKIETELTDIHIKAEENMKKTNKLAIARNELNNLRFKLEVENNNKYSSETIKLNNEKSILENKLRLQQQNIDMLKIQIENDNKRKQDLYKKWDEVSRTQVEFDENSFICPTCKREYESEQKEEIKQQFVDKVNSYIKSEQQKINNEGQTINKRIEENASTLEKLEKEIEETKQNLAEVNKRLVTSEEKQKTQENIDITTLPEYQLKLQEVEKFKAEVDKLTSEDTTEIQNRKATINKQIEHINEKLAEARAQKTVRQTIEERKNEEKENAQKIQQFEHQQYLIEEMKKLKVSMNEDIINSKFELVKFKLLTEKNNGAIVQTCEATVNGVPYSDLNNAHKILAGLDIIKTLIKFYNISAPIFIDNRESINSLCTIDAQIISLVVTTDSQLRIEVI